MAEILVNKGELKDIRDSIDKLLKSGKENVTGHTQYTSYESEELSEREKKILKYIENNPGRTKEDVIKYMEKERICSSSRVTTVNLIKDLIEEGMLIVRRDDSNQHIQHLYVNNENVVLSLLNDFEFFKQVYFKLVDETTNLLKKLSQTDPLIIWNVYDDLVRTLLIPYKHLIIVYITSDLLLWRQQAPDKEALHNKFAIVYGNMKEIHTKLHESIAPLNTAFFYEPRYGGPDTEHDLSQSLYGVQDLLDFERIESFLSHFKQFELNTSAEAVLDVLWKISYPLASKLSLRHTYKRDLRDWRNIISGYKPKTTQVQNLGENNISGSKWLNV